MNGVTKNQLEFLDVVSVHPVNSVFVTFIFVGIHHSVDVYAIFWFEPLHNLFLWVFWLLKELIWNILGDDSRETRANKTRYGSNKTFEAVKVMILSALNMVLTDYQKRLIGTGIHVNFRKPRQSNRRTGLHWVWPDWHARKGRLWLYWRGVPFSRCSCEWMLWLWAICRCHRGMQKIRGHVERYLPTILVPSLEPELFGADRSQNSAT